MIIWVADLRNGNQPLDSVVCLERTWIIWGVDTGDVFLFFGMFRQTGYRSDGTLLFIPDAPIRQIIYGYMKVGEILYDEQEIIKRYPWHPHAVNPDRRNNRLYIPDTYGTFRYSPTLVLTKPGQYNRSLWSLPKFFADDGVSISYHNSNRPTLAGNYAELQSVRQGQEFVITTSTATLQQMLTRWVDELIGAGMQ